VRAPILEKGRLWILAIFAWMAVVVILLVNNGRNYRSAPVVLTASCDADSVTVYPESVTLPLPGDTLQLTAICWWQEKIIGCSGACDTIPEHLWHPDTHTDGAEPKVQI
jgi:hypothetical protein